MHAILAVFLAVAQDEPQAGWSELVPRVEGAKHYYVAPDGKKESAGTKEEPWDFASAISGEKKVEPGSVIWVRGGRYKGNPEVNKGKFVMTLAGKEGAPIHLRAYPGERATILDTTLWVMQGTDYVWIWDLELAGSAPVEKRETKQTGSHPSDLPGGDGLNVYAGKGCKFVNLVIHDNVGNGMGWWVGSTGSEVHGCVIYANGWRAPDRGHGHCIYTQNKEGTKIVSSCIFTVPYDGQYTLHAYGSSRAFISNYVVEDNIAFGRGTFLIGGGSPSRNIKVSRNYLHGIGMRIGYGAQNEDCELRGNVIAKGQISIQKYQKVVDEENARDFKETKAVVIPNKYDPRRAHVAVYNGAKAAEVEVPVGTFLKPGDAFRLMNPFDLFGKPLVEGKCEGETLKAPISGDFAPFVLLKD